MSNAPEMSPEIGDSSLSAYADIFGVAGLITHAKIHKILILCLLQFRFCGARITWFVSRTPFFTHNILEVYLLEFLSMLLSILDTEMEVPLPYSPFHIFFVIAGNCEFLCASVRHDFDLLVSDANIIAEKSPGVKGSMKNFCEQMF